MSTADILMQLSWISLFTGGLAALIYVTWWLGTRSDKRPRSDQRQVTVEASWGMVLALTALFFVLAQAAEPGNPVWLRVLCLGAVAGFYAIPLSAAYGARIPRWTRWVPAVVACSVRPLIVVMFCVMYWHWLTALLIIAIGTGLGVVLLAECLVAVRFAKAVARRDNRRPRVLPANQEIPLPSRGFVWPH